MFGFGGADGPSGSDESTAGRSSTTAFSASSSRGSSIIPAEDPSKHDENHTVQGGLLKPAILSATEHEVFTLCPGVGAKNFVFDSVLDQSSPQTACFELIKPLATTFLNGENCCAFCYGQTGSGKTYTMFGEEEGIDLFRECYDGFRAERVGGRGVLMEEGDAEVDTRSAGRGATETSGSSTPLGLIPQALLYLLVHKPQRCTLALQYFEIYGNVVTDLLAGAEEQGFSSGGVELYWNGNGGAGENGSGINPGFSDAEHEQDATGAFRKVSQHGVRCADDVHSLLQFGNCNKRSAQTAMNLRSTRAHSVVRVKLFIAGETVTLVTGNSEQDAIVVDEGAFRSSLVLLDLGGAEKLSRSKAHEHVILPPGGLVAGGLTGTTADGMGNSPAHGAEGETQPQATTDRSEESSLFPQPPAHARATSWRDYYQARERVQETANINLGLLALKRCLAALLEQQEHVVVRNTRASGAPGVSGARIPFYDNKLTQIMKESLLSKNLLCIVCAAPEEANAAESISALRFGEVCRQLGRVG